jgi:uncharacterized protein (TIGR03437 family)
VTDQYFLELFGTGIGGRTSQAAVSVAVGGTDVAVVYAGAQGFYPGLDLVNVRLPPTLGRGVLDVTLTVDDLPANTVRIEIK